MKFYLEKVLERDIDLYIINKFINDVSFKNLFLNKIGLKGYKINKCIHSFLDSDGESDITIIMENGKEKIGLLIENKIDAIAMPNQYERYKIRGNKIIESGDINRYYIFIIAPNDYLKINAEAQKYDYKVTYEDILKLIDGDIYGEELIKKAIKEKKKGYSVVEDKAVTEFWKKYYELVESKYPMLNIKKHENARGSRACWPIFQTSIKNVQIFHKSDKGNADLTLIGMAPYYFEVNNMINQELKDNMHLQVTGESLAIRIKVPIIDFKKDFNEQLKKITECLDVILKLQNLTKTINFSEIMSVKK